MNLKQSGWATVSGTAIRVKLRNSTVNCQKHVVPVHVVKGIVEVEFHNHIVRQHSLKKSASGIDGSLTTARYTNHQLAAMVKALQLVDFRNVCTLRGQTSESEAHSYWTDTTRLLIHRQYRWPRKYWRYFGRAAAC